MAPHDPNACRKLLIVADDYGIGPATSRGILQLANLGRITGAALLVNSPYAESGVAEWRAAGRPIDLGWHPCLTLDRPLLPPGKVRSLVDGDGRFLTLGRWMRRWALGRIDAGHVEAELQAQANRFRELVGEPPTFVNAHHHLQVFPVVGRTLRAILRDHSPRPYLRRVQEPAATFLRIGGARAKRAFLNVLGRRQTRIQIAEGFPGNETFAGLSANDLRDDDFFANWIRNSTGDVVEVMCHPGHLDETLRGRDDMIENRVWEFQQLAGPALLAAVTSADFRLISPREMTDQTKSAPTARAS